MTSTPRTRDQLLADVAEVVHRVTGTAPEEVRPERAWVADLRVDSLSMVEVLEGAAQRTGVVVADEDTRRLVRVGDLLDLLEQA